MTKQQVINDITNYLLMGGLVNPELADHDRVRELLYAIRELLQKCG